MPNILTPEWVKDAIFYQIFPDRFARSDRSPLNGLKFEAWDTPPSTFGFKGGDLRGIVDRLDYLKELGVTALYLNPIFASASNHRYHTYDYFNIDPLLGGNAALRELLEQAHARGMKVVLDGVFNHASRGLWQFNHVLETGAASPYVDWFHFNPEFLRGKRAWGAYPGPEQIEMMKRGASSYDALGYHAWWNLPALPKFNTKTPAVRQFLFEAAEFWIKFGADGWRLDVASEIDDDSFWQEFRRRVKAINPQAYIVGEIWHESQRWLQGDQFDAVMNYLVTGALLGWLVGERMGPEAYNAGDYRRYLRPLNAQEFAARIAYILGLYDPQINQAQLNLLDSHDTPRFLTLAGGDKSALTLGWFFLMTYPGAPSIYYGDEIGLEGGPDPDCRRAFPWQNQAAWDKNLLATLRELIALRKTQPALRRGAYLPLLAENNTLAYARRLENDTLLCVINAAREVRDIQIPTAALGGQNGQPKHLWGHGTMRSEAGSLSLRLGPREAGIFKIAHDR
ncbi:MAG: glycoside hydrolase family 13 protein [Anaerolineales bacterium]